MHIFTSVMHVLWLKCVWVIPLNNLVCVTGPGAQFRNWSGPYRDTGAGQPLAIWLGSLFFRLTSYLDCGTHTTTTSLESEEGHCAQYDNRRKFQES